MVRKEFSIRSQRPIRESSEGIRRTQIYCCRTSDVPAQEYAAGMYGVRKILAETGRTLAIKNFGFFDTGAQEFGSPDWYQSKALTQRMRGFGRQVSAAELDHLLRTEPYQSTNPHFDVFILNKDLTTSRNDPQNNFIFGYGPYPNNIISVTRFMGIANPTLRRAAISVLTAHELGHNFDLVARNFNMGTQGYKNGHCNGESGPCLMEQVNVPGARSIEDQAALLFNRRNWLCGDCQDEITAKREYYSQHHVPW